MRLLFARPVLPGILRFHLMMDTLAVGAVPPSGLQETPHSQLTPSRTQVLKEAPTWGASFTGCTAR